MKQYYNILKQSELFKGMDDNGLENVLSCLDPKIATAKKGEIILLAGDEPENIGIVLSGELHIIKEDYDGKRIIMANISQSGLYAEAICCAGVTESPVTVMANTNVVVMELSYDKVLHTCPKNCVFHNALIENMLVLMAQKNMMLQNRMDIISVRSIRERVMRYLYSFKKKDGEQFTIPFNREGLADYLCVERSALSHELSLMKKDSIIEYNKNVFTLK